MTDAPPTITIARMGQSTWHILVGHVTDDIMKTACGLRAVPINAAEVDGRAIRHAGSDVCANCRNQFTLKNTTEGGTMSESITDDLQKEAGKAAATAQPPAAPEAKAKGGTATATRTRGWGKTKLSAIKAAEQILRKEGKPMHVKELTEKILAMPETKLGGKTPDATVGAILAVNIKKSDTVFRRTKPSTYGIRKGK